MLTYLLQNSENAKLSIMMIFDMLKAYKIEHKL